MIGAEVFDDTTMPLDKAEAPAAAAEKCVEFLKDFEIRSDLDNDEEVLKELIAQAHKYSDIVRLYVLNRVNEEKEVKVQRIFDGDKLLRTIRVGRDKEKTVKGTLLINSNNIETSSDLLESLHYLFKHLHDISGENIGVDLKTEFANTLKEKKREYVRQKKVPVSVKNGSKSLGEEFIIDVLYFIVASLFGFLYGSIPVVPVVGHLFLSTAGAIVSFIRIPRFGVNRVVWAGFCTTATLLLDGVAICQIFASVFSKKVEQTGLLAGVADADDPVFFGSATAAFFVAGAAATFRLHKIRLEGKTCFSQVCTGATLAGTLVYAAWTLDFGQGSLNWHAIIAAILILPCGVEIGRLIWETAKGGNKKNECGELFAHSSDKAVDAWSAAAYGITALYYVLFINTAAGFASGKMSLPHVGHGFGGAAENFQALFLTGTLLFCRVVISTTIADDLRRLVRRNEDESNLIEGGVNKNTIKVKKINKNVIRGALFVLPSLGALIVAFERDGGKKNFSEFTLITFIYSTLSYLRFWTLDKSEAPGTRKVVGGTGIGLDVCYLLLLLIDWFARNIFLSSTFSRATLVGDAALALAVSAYAVFL